MSTAKTIIRQSFFPLIFASTLSSIGGLALMVNREKILVILPLIIIFPPLNNMVGNYGTIISSKFTTMLEMKEIPKKWWKSHRLEKLFKRILVIALVYTSLIAIFASASAHLQDFPTTSINLLKTLTICLTIAIFMTTTIFLITVIVGLWLAKRGKDPDNYLVPLVTGLADLGCLILFSTLVSLLF